MTWPTGRDEVRRLLAEGRLEQVTANLDDARALLSTARTHVGSAELIADADADGAYALLYDAARKGLTALLQAQGLRPTSRGGHVAVQEVIRAQFTHPPPRDAFRAFARMRTTRHTVEYAPRSTVTSDDVVADLSVVRRLLDVADLLVDRVDIFV